jgi:tetratricopeptide (TPR) repeat protein
MPSNKKHYETHSDTSKNSIKSLPTTNLQDRQQSNPTTLTIDSQILLNKQIEHGEHLAENQSVEKALEYFELLNILNPHNGRILNNIGVLKHASGDIKRSIEYLFLSLKHNPCSLDTAVNLIDLLLDTNEPNKALAIVIDFVSDRSNPFKQQMMEQIQGKFSPEQISKINQHL